MIILSLALLLAQQAIGRNPILQDPAFSYIDIYQLKAFRAPEIALATLLKEGISQNADINDAQVIVVPEIDDDYTFRPYEIFHKLRTFVLIFNPADCARILGNVDSSKLTKEGVWGCDPLSQGLSKEMNRYFILGGSRENLKKSLKERLSNSTLKLPWFDHYVSSSDKVVLSIVPDLTSIPISEKDGSILNEINSCYGVLLYIDKGDGEVLEKLTVPKFQIPDLGHLTVKFDYSKGKGYVYKTDTSVSFCAPDLKADLEFDLQYYTC